MLLSRNTEQVPTVYIEISHIAPDPDDNLIIIITFQKKRIQIPFSTRNVLGKYASKHKSLRYISEELGRKPLNCVCALCSFVHVNAKCIRNHSQVRIT